MPWIFFLIFDLIKYIKKITFSQFFGQIHIKWQQWSWIDTLYVKFDETIANFRGIQEFQVITERLQEWWNFVLKIGFLDKNWVGTYTLFIKIGPTTTNQGNSRILECLDSRVQKLVMLPKLCKVKINYEADITFLDFLYQKQPSFNPIPYGLWNVVVIWGVFLTCSSFELYNLGKSHANTQNLFTDIFFDIQTSFETTTSTVKKVWSSIFVCESQSTHA